MGRLMCLPIRVAVLLCAVSAILLGARGVAVAHDGAHVTVRAGDTLSQIAKNHGQSTSAILQLNNLGSANHIRVGQVLAIPGTASAGAVSIGVSSSNSDLLGWQTYVVQRGDSLSVLARDYRVGLARLAEVNLISPSQNLYVGQTLKLPAAASTIGRAGISAGSTSADASTHIVQRGEHLGLIANRYGVESSAIAWANNLSNANRVFVGQRLRIPSAGAKDVQDYSTFPTTTEKWIDVNLSNQTVTAYDGTQAVASFLVSTGLPGTPTVQGTFRIWATTPIQDMFRLSRAGGNDSSSAEGYDYYLKDVQWVQYFHQDYAFHASYWHNNFGQPMSRGCVNMRTDDAKWLFDWASPQASKSAWTFLSGYNSGTLVKVHY